MKRWAVSRAACASSCRPLVCEVCARDKKGLRSREKRFTLTSVSLAGGARAATKEDERA